MQVSNEIITVLEYLGEKMGIVVDWTSANLFPYLQELCNEFIRWEIGTSIVWMVLALMVIGVTFIIQRGSGWDDFDKLIFVMIIILAVIVMVEQIFDIVECCTFPEKAVYDYIRWRMES